MPLYPVEPCEASGDVGDTPIGPLEARVPIQWPRSNSLPRNLANLPLSTRLAALTILFRNSGPLASSISTKDYLERSETFLFSGKCIFCEPLRQLGFNLSALRICAPKNSPEKHCNSETSSGNVSFDEPLGELGCNQSASSPEEHCSSPLPSPRSIQVTFRSPLPTPISRWPRPFKSTYEDVVDLLFALLQQNYLLFPHSKAEPSQATVRFISYYCPCCGKLYDAQQMSLCRHIVYHHPDYTVSQLKLNCRTFARMLN